MQLCSFISTLSCNAKLKCTLKFGHSMPLRIRALLQMLSFFTHKQSRLVLLSLDLQCFYLWLCGWRDNYFSRKNVSESRHEPRTLLNYSICSDHPTTVPRAKFSRIPAAYPPFYFHSLSNLFSIVAHRGGGGEIRNSWSVAKAWNRWYTCCNDHVGAVTSGPDDNSTIRH